MNNWVFDGWVPSILSDRSPRERLETEIWLAQNNVPYSNLIFGVENFATMSWHIDASFLITTLDKAYDYYYKMHDGCNMYVVETLGGARTIGDIEVLGSYEDITKKEKGNAE